MAANPQKKKLLELAQEQGWTVEADGNKIRWTGPDGQGPVFSSFHQERETQGRALPNLIAQLGRAGLDISSLKNDKAKAKAKPEPEFDLAAQSLLATMTQLRSELEGAITASSADDFPLADFVLGILSLLSSYVTAPTGPIALFSAGVQDEIQLASAEREEMLKDAVAAEERAVRAERDREQLVSDLREARAEAKAAVERALELERRLGKLREALNGLTA